jgi:hypothetical protein
LHNQQRALNVSRWNGGTFIPVSNAAGRFEHRTPKNMPNGKLVLKLSPNTADI